jgi:hypothetical protein
MNHANAMRTHRKPLLALILTTMHAWDAPSPWMEHGVVLLTACDSVDAMDDDVLRWRSSTLRREELLRLVCASVGDFVRLCAIHRILARAIAIT